MPKRITIEPHLSLDELESRYRGASDPIERSHYQIIWLLAQGRSSSEVAAVTSYSRSWIYELVWGFDKSRQNGQAVFERLSVGIKDLSLR